MKNLVIAFLLILVSFAIKAQEPSFTQYSNLPLLINPAAAGSSDLSWRFNNIYRQQFIDNYNSFNTIATSIDGKPFRSNGLGLGALFLSDQSLGGAVKNIVTSANLSYTVFLDQNLNNKLSVGFAGIYGNRKVDFSNLEFANQFVNNIGFDQNLYSGEIGINASSNYFTSASGLIYNYKTKEIEFEIGGAGFNLHKVKNSLLSDSLNYIDKRYSFNSKVLFNIGENSGLDFNILYQNQQKIQYYIFGVIYTKNNITKAFDSNVSGGLFYNSNNIITPYLGFKLSGVELHLSYDVILSSSKINYSIPKTLEFSINILPIN